MQWNPGRASGADPLTPAGHTAAPPAAGTAPGVFILSDVRLYREGLAMSLSHQPSIVVLGVAEISASAVLEVVRRKPDVVILDIAGPGSFDLAKSLNAQLPTVKIIGFAVSEIEHEVLACAAAGLAGYVARDGSEADLLAAIANALRGELFCSPRMAGLLFRHVAALSARQQPAKEPAVLTPREQQILALLGRGMSNKEIAREARIGNATVKNHVHNILEKLEVRRRGEAVARFRTLQHSAMSRRRPDPSPDPMRSTEQIALAPPQREEFAYPRSGSAAAVRPDGLT